MNTRVSLFEPLVVSNLTFAAASPTSVMLLNWRD